VHRLLLLLFVVVSSVLTCLTLLTLQNHYLLCGDSSFVGMTVETGMTSVTE